MAAPPQWPCHLLGPVDSSFYSYIHETNLSMTSPKTLSPIQQDSNLLVASMSGHYGVKNGSMELSLNHCSERALTFSVAVS